MALGIALMIRARLGLAPWDVLHMGLANVTPLTVGTWLQLVGLAVISLASIIARRWPGPGAVLNMLLVGLFVDWFLQSEWLFAPETLYGRWLALLSGLVLIGVGNGLYIAPRLGAGPRDALVLVLADKLSLSISWIRVLLEVSVLAAGWLLGGPVFVGTLLFSLSIGPMMQLSIQFWEKMIKQWLGRGVGIEGVHQRTLRPHHHDGFSSEVRG